MDVQPLEDSVEGSGAFRIPSISQAASRPTCIICLGMVGSGKITFVQVTIMFLVDNLALHYSCI